MTPQNPVLATLIELGPSVVLPVVLFVLGLALGLAAGRSFRAALMVGIGFVGINLVVGLLGSSVGPAAQAMVQHTGIQLTFLDVGWPSSSAIAYGSVVGSLAIPVGLVVNAVMLLAGLTRTADIDLWNYWHVAFVGAVVFAIDGDLGLALVAEVLAMVVVLTLADASQPWVREIPGFEKISFPHATATPYFLLALGLQALFDRIPGLRSWEASPEQMQKRLGVFGDTAVLGLVFGLIIGIVAGQTWTAVLTLGVTVAAVMVLLPRVVALLMEGLIPIADRASALLQKRFPNRTVYVGMDVALLVGQPATIAASVALVPITLALAFVLPGVRTLPFVDLATIPFIIALMTPVFRGNVVRTILGGAIAMIPTLYISTALGPLITSAARTAGFAFPADATDVTSLVDGGNPLPGLVRLLAAAGWIGIGVGLVLAVVAAWLVNRRGRDVPSEDVAPAPAEVTG